MNAADPRPDTAGRILVPAWMRDQIGLDREVIVGGAHEYLGIYRADYVDHRRSRGGHAVPPPGRPVGSVSLTMPDSTER